MILMNCEIITKKNNYPLANYKLQINKKKILQIAIQKSKTLQKMDNSLLWKILVQFYYYLTEETSIKINILNNQLQNNIKMFNYFSKVIMLKICKM